MWAGLGSGLRPYDPLADASQPVGALVFGPNISRRLGRVLGINILPPGRAMCTYRCAYCPLAHAVELVDPRTARASASWPTPEQVAGALAQVLEELAPSYALDALVLIGNGEPTLHPRLPEVVEALRKAGEAHAPGAELVVFTNSSLLAEKRVLEALALADQVVAKLDAVDEGLRQAINRPHPSLARLPRVLEALLALRRALSELGGRLVVSTTLLELPSGLTNAKEKHLRQLGAFLSLLSPEQVHLEMPLLPPGSPAQASPRHEVARAALRLAEGLGDERVFVLAGTSLPVPARLLRKAGISPPPSEGRRRPPEAALLLLEGPGGRTRLRILEVLAARRMNCHQVAKATGISWWTAQKHLQRLLEAGLVRTLPLGRRTYYAITPAGLTALEAIRADEGRGQPPTRLL